MQIDFSEARNTCEKAIELAPQGASDWYRIGIIYSMIKDNAKALPSFQKAVELEPEDGAYRASLSGILRKLGQEPEAAEEAKVARLFIDRENEYNRACFESICGNTEEALLLLKIALEKKQTDLEGIQQDPDFYFIQDDPRFKELVRLE